MSKWLFVSGITRGSYTIVDTDGDTRERVGLDLNLGIGEGNTIEEAASMVIRKAVEQEVLSDGIKNSIVGYEIKDNGKVINIENMVKIAKGDVPKQKKEEPRFGNVQCKWCPEAIPPNGIVMFSHLKKHVAQLVEKKYLDRNQLLTFNSVKLTKEMEEIFEKAKNEGAFK